MTHARIPDFSQPVPVRPADRRAACAVALGLDPRAIKPAHQGRAACALALTGELLTATIIIAGGLFAYGYLPIA